MKKILDFLLALLAMLGLCTNNNGLDSLKAFFHWSHTFDRQVIDEKYLKSPATCTERAAYYYSCSCGKAGSDFFEIGEAPGHSFDASVLQEPSCSQAGIKRSICTRCGYVRDEAILYADYCKIVPDQYVRVDYIESTGTQYIDTGFAATDGMTVSCECMWLGNTGGYMVGSHGIGSPYGRNGGYLDIGRHFWELGFGETFPNSKEYLDVVGKKVSVSFSTVSGNAYLTVDGHELIRSSGTEKTSATNVMLFTQQYEINNHSATTLGRLYAVSIWDKDGRLVREYLPVLRASDSMAGMYDTVTGRFFSSEADAFAYGNILYHRFGEAVTVKEPTYCETGIRARVCSDCGMMLREESDRTAFLVRFDCPEGGKVFVYDTQDYSAPATEASVAYSRNNESFAYSKQDAQINFRVELPDGCLLKGITVDGEYKNLKNPKKNIYRITKINSDLTVRVEAGIPLSFSNGSGFYKNGLRLEMNAPVGTIYYTLDGSEPTEQSLVYTGPLTITDASSQPNTNSMLTTTSGGFLEDKINALGNNSNEYPYTVPGYKAPDSLIDKCTVIRAVAIDGDYSSEEVSGSYFVGFDEKSGYDNTGIISLIADPDDFFGYENGIYVRGKTYDSVDSSTQWYAPYWWWWWGNYSNSGDAWERKVSLSFFNEDKELILEKNGGARIHGNGSRGYIEKSLNLYARDEYDNQNYFDYDFFGTGYLPQRMTLSSGGDDYTTKLDDYLMSATGQNADYCIAKMQRYCLFINGEFWGYYYLSEKQDEEYFNYYYNVDKDNLILIKNDEIEEGTADDMSCYREMIDFISSNDMAIEKNYQRALELIDIDSFIDYYAAMAYIDRNGDWPGSNKALWRSREKGSSPYEDCKWRYMMFDLNSGAYGQFDRDSVSYIASNDRMFRHLYRNEEFKASFDARLVTLASTRFQPETVNTVIDTFAAETREQMINEYKRFFGSDNTKITDTFDARVASVRLFMNKRAQYILETYATDIAAQ